MASKVIVFAIVAAGLKACTAATEAVNKDMVVDNVDRAIDLTTHVVKINTKVTVRNSGSAAASAVHYAVEASISDHVAFIGAVDQHKRNLRVVEAPGVKFQGADGPTDAVFYRIVLGSALASKSAAVITVTVLLNGAYEMLPKTIAQGEKQLTMYNGNHYAFLPYPCATQTTTVTVASPNIESYSSDKKPASASGATITYGPYKNVPALAYAELNVHSENNSPFLVVTRMERTVEISMWGNIAVEETIDMRHSGALLRGPFSRYDYQRDNSAAQPSVKGFKTFLPASARGVYYRDDIGNISTSAMRELADTVELALRPRFPLFGGWRTHYTVGYNVPSYEYLYAGAGDQFALDMRLVDHVYDDMIVEDLTLRIVLPEGSAVGQFKAPYPILRLADDTVKTYLDTYGRVVVVVKNAGVLTEKHIENFRLDFTFSRSSLIREPLMLIAAFFIFFLTVIIYVRMDFSITKDEGLEAKLKVAGVCGKVASAQERRANIYDQFDEALVKLKASKDVTTFQATNRKITNDHKAETQAVADLASALASTEAAEKVAELQKLDRIWREFQANQAVLVEKLVGNKLTKQQFIDQESVIVKKKDDCREKMGLIVFQLGSM